MDGRKKTRESDCPGPSFNLGLSTPVLLFAVEKQVKTCKNGGGALLFSMITKINSTEGEGARRFSQSSATSRGSLASSTGAKAPAFLQSLKQSLTAECEAVAQKVVAVRDKLTEIERFAADDWQTTEGEVEKLKQRFESRKVREGVISR